MNEELIQNYMTTLDISREDAIQLIKDDMAVDKMDSIKELQNDLTAEQKKVVKSMKNTRRGVDAFGKKRVREVKSSPNKLYLITKLLQAMQADERTSEVRIDEKTKEGKIHFDMGGKHYTIMLTEHRK